MENQKSQELTNGVKYDNGKAMYSLLPPSAIHLVAKVLTFGARKYSPDNWKKVPNLRSRYIDALLRHVFAYMRGERVDQESNLPHLAHAICCILFILEADILGIQTTDKGE